MGDLLYQFKIALVFLTRLPAYLEREPKPDDLAGSVPMFGLIGVLVGLSGAGVYALAWQLGLTSFLAATLAVGAQILITGGLHEDGIADLADGLGGGRTRADKLRIMRDSTIGTFGTLAIGLALLLRVGALATLAEPGLVAAALVAAGALSRSLLALLMTTWPGARDDGQAAAAGRPDPLRSGASVLIGMAIVLLVLPPEGGLAASLAGLAAALVIGALARHQIGGMTGDVLGAGQQAAEIALLLVLASLPR